MTRRARLELKGKQVAFRRRPARLLPQAASLREERAGAPLDAGRPSGELGGVSASASMRVRASRRASFPAGSVLRGSETRGESARRRAAARRRRRRTLASELAIELASVPARAPAKAAERWEERPSTRARPSANISAQAATSGGKVSPATSARTSWPPLSAQFQSR